MQWVFLGVQKKQKQKNSKGEVENEFYSHEELVHYMYSMEHVATFNFTIK